jgi:hypothetical protein
MPKTERADQTVARLSCHAFVAVSVWLLVRGSVGFPWLLSASARRSTRRDRLEARCPRIQHHHPTA